MRCRGPRGADERPAERSCRSSDSVGNGSRVAPEDDPADAVRRNDEPAPGRPEPEFLRGHEGDDESDSREAEVAGHRRGREEPDPAVDEITQRRAIPFGSALHLDAPQSEAEGDHRDEPECKPPRDLSQGASEDGRKAESGNLHRRERSDAPAEHAWWHGFRERGEENRREEGVRRTHERSAGDERPDVRGERAEERRRSEREVCRSDGSAGTDPLGDRPGEELEGRERDHVRGDRSRHEPTDVSSPSATLGISATSIAPPNGPRNPPA